MAMLRWLKRSYRHSKRLIRREVGIDVIAREAPVAIIML